MPLVSIIVPVHNMGSYVAECLSSIECQSLRDIEVLCIDGASSDDSLALCRAFAEQDARFKVISLDCNVGAAGARNRGLEIAQGDFVMFMDADDWYPADTTVERLYRAAVDHGARIAGGQMCEVDAKTGRARTDYRDEDHLSLYNFDGDGMVSYRDWQGDLGYTRFIYERSLLEENNLRFPALCRYEDPVFFVKTMLAAGEFYAIAEPVYCYRVNYKPVELSREAVGDAVEAIVELLVIAQENDLQKLKGWLVDSLQWYLAYDVYHSSTYRLGDALAAPLRKLKALAGRVAPARS